MVAGVGWWGGGAVHHTGLSRAGLSAVVIAPSGIPGMATAETSSWNTGSSAPATPAGPCGGGRPAQRSQSRVGAGMPNTTDG